MNQQEIRFCSASDGVRLAYATVGKGYPIVKAANWLSHLEADWQSPVWGHLYRDLAADHQLIRYDERGTGLSDRDVEHMSCQHWASDLETVVDAAGLDRFALLGISQGGPVAISYAARHPERVSHLILYATFVRFPGRPADEQQALLALMRAGWGRETSEYRQVFTSLFIPDASADQMRWFNELERRSASPETAARILTEIWNINVAEMAARITVPTLIVHCNGDQAVPFSAGRELAALVPGARFVPTEGANHYFLEHDPAREVFLRELHAFLGDAPREPKPPTYARTDATTRMAAAGEKSFSSGRYVVRRVLGEGGQKVVYLVHDNALDRDCALALIRNEDLGPDDLLRFQREAQAMARLGAHSNIVSVFDIGEQDGRPFLVSEYIAGGDLRQLLLKRGRLPLDEALAVGSDIARALAVAHARGVVHRDIKPLNVWLTEDGAAKLGDFGLAFSLDRSRMTMPGTVMGTAAYLAPEQALGEPVTERSDLYALGCLLYEMVCGRPPFADANATAVIAQHLNAIPAAPSSHEPDVPPTLEDLILRLLSKSPGQRPQSALAVLEELRRIGDSAPAVTVGTASSAPPPDGDDTDAGALEPAIQYTNAVDGVSIAWWEAGDGYPLIDVHPPPFSNIRLDWQNIPFHQRLAERFRLIRFDTRGSGLSQRDAADVSVDAMVADMEAVVAAAGIERFAVFSDHGAAPVTIAYAIKYPNRVSHLVLFNPYLDQREFLDTPRMKALDSVLESDWELYTEGLASTVYGWESDETRGYARLLRDSVEPDMARKVIESLGRCDMAPLLGSVSVPTLVLHFSSSEFPSLRAAQFIAAGIPGARLRTGAADKPWSNEVETSTVDAVREFVGMSRPPAN